MALTPSTMLPLGTIAPDFTLLDVVSGTKKSLSDLKSDKGTVILFICNHCPFVKHIQKELVSVAKTYQAKGIKFIAISSNDAEGFPEDGPSQMKQVAQEFAYPFPYLYDETQDVAKSYQAACTPDLYVFDKILKCVYRGQFDDSRPKNGIPVTGKDLSQALDSLLTGQLLSEDQKPSIGCNIKWKE